MGIKFNLHFYIISFINRFNASVYYDYRYFFTSYGIKKYYLYIDFLISTVLIEYN